MLPNDPHHGQPIYSLGAPLAQAKAAVLMLHGRNAEAHSILALASALEVADVAYLAPQASGYIWYPQRFLAPLESNEPWLTSALNTVARTLAMMSGAGIPPERTMLLGFSQGACLALEFAARNARRYGGLIGLSGGLIGPDDTPRDYPGSLAGTPVFLGCSDVDFHIPKERVEHSAAVLRQLGGAVTMRLYPNMDHTVNDDELEFTRTLLKIVISER